MSSLMKIFIAGLVLAISAEASAVNIIGDVLNSATNVGASSSLGNGDYQLSTPPAAGSAIPYTDIPNWFNAGNAAGASDAETINHGQTANLGSLNPQAGATPNIGAFQFTGRININDTGYSPAAGDVFSFGTYFQQAGGGNNSGDALTVGLYTSAVPVDGAVTVADLMPVVTTSVAVSNVQGYYTANNFYTATGSEGTLYLGLSLNAVNPTMTFSRTDLVNLSVVPVPEPSSLGLMSLMGLGLLLWKRSYR